MLKKQVTKLFKGTAIYGLGSIANKFLSFFLLPIFTAYLTPSDYGIIAMLGFITFLASPVFLLGFGTSKGVVYYESEDNSWKSSVTWSAFVILIGSVTLLIISGFLLSKELSLWLLKDAKYSLYIKLHLITTSFNILTNPFILRLQFEQKAKSYVIASTSGALSIILFNVLFVVVLQYGVFGWVIGSLIGQIFGFFLFLLFVVKGTPFKINKTVSARLLKFGFPMIPSFIFLFAIEHSGKYFFQMFHELDGLGLYNIGANFGNIMLLPVSAFSTAWYPYFQSYINNKEEAKLLFGQIFYYYLAGFGFLAVCFFLFAKPAILLFTQESFHLAFQIVGILALGQFFVGVFNNFLVGVYYAKKVYLISVVQFVSAAIVVSLNYFLIPLYGFTIIAVIVTIGFGTMSIFMQWVNVKQKLWQPIYNWPKIMLLIINYGVVICIVYIASMTLSTTIYLLLTPVFLIGTLALIWLNFSKKERNTVLASISKLKKKYTS
ncbi:hypothetical protein BKI52_25840 [marine bacterium AO1-C]|nr:hypothetical protein BKI52_25840 [marine bacterium AO1-C]